MALPDSLNIPQSLMLLELLESDGGSARYVGGCVRDSLMNRPFSDIDVATSHTPEEVITLLTKEGIKVIPTGIKHGTVTAIVNHRPYEITTLRRDEACDGRHAEVAFTDSWEEDAARRDFTMNAMSIDRQGNLFDYYSGKADMRVGLVRFVGNAEQRIREDFLRILRFFRFHSYYGQGDMLSEHVEACTRFISSVVTLSGERIQQEMMKLLAAPNPAPVLAVMNEITILAALCSCKPERLNVKAVESLARIEAEAGAQSHLVRLGCIALASEMDEKQVRELSSMWRLSNKDAFYVLSLAIPVFPFAFGLTPMQQKQAIRTLGKGMFVDSVYVHWALATSKLKSDEDVALIDAQFSAMLQVAEEWDVPEFPLTGEDVIGLGVKPGKQVGELLSEAEAYWEQEDYRLDKATLLKFVKDEI